jgi:uncharacterized protein (TIGR00369 family)
MPGRVDAVEGDEWMHESKDETTDPLKRVRTSFRRQGLMRLLGAEVVEAGEGRSVIEVPFHDDLTQQERYFHGAVIGAIADNAGGYAALTLAPPDREVLTVEYKVNFLAPAWGDKLVARGEVLSAGRRLFVCRAEVEAVAGDERRTCATLLQTVSLSPVREEIRDDGKEP